MENKQQNQPKNTWFLPVSILVAGVLVAGALIYNVGADQLAVDDGVEDEQLVASVGAILDEVIQDKIVLGDADAPITIVEVSDYQCPFCGKFSLESGKQLREEYVRTGKAKMVMMDLAFLGSESVQAAQAARCAGDQEEYWAYHDKLFSYIWDNYYAKGENGENVGAFSDDNLKLFAEELELDTEQFNKCLDSEKYIGAVESDYNAAQKLLGDRLSTPSIFIGDKLIQGAQPYETFKQAIEEALNN